MKLTVLKMCFTLLQCLFTLCEWNLHSGGKNLKICRPNIGVESKNWGGGWSTENAGGNLLQVLKVRLDEEVEVQWMLGVTEQVLLGMSCSFECPVRVWLIDQLYDLFDWSICLFIWLCLFSYLFIHFIHSWVWSVLWRKRWVDSVLSLIDWLTAVSYTHLTLPTMAVV